MYHIITNPSSRSGRNAEPPVLNSLKASLTASSIPYEVIYTRGPGHAAELGHLYSTTDSVETVVIIGGDGTINEFLSGVVDPSSICLGILPSGSGNDLARGIGLKDPKKDPKQNDTIRRITEGKVLHTVDLGILRYVEPAAGQRYFVISSGIGFDAAVCAESKETGEKAFFNRLHLGGMIYGYLALKHFASYFAHQVSCELIPDDCDPIPLKRFLFAAAMNHAYEGGGYRFAPDADPSDGCLNLLVIGDMPWYRLLPAFPLAHAGKHYDIRGVIHMPIRKAVIRSAEPVWVHTDGEVSIKAKEISFEVQPQALKLIV